MQSTKVTSRYAKALLQLAVEHNILEQVRQDMDQVLSICQTNKEFRKMLQSPIIKAYKKEAILSEIFKTNTQKLTLEFLLLITRKRRESCLEGIAEQFIDQYKELKNIKKAIVKTAVKLDETTKNKIIQTLKNYTKSQIELIEEIDTNLLGGFVLNFDNKQYDSSVLSKLQKMSKKFEVTAFETHF